MVQRGRSLRAILEFCLPCCMTSGKLPTLFQDSVFIPRKEKSNKSSHIEFIIKTKEI